MFKMKMLGIALLVGATIVSAAEAEKKAEAKAEKKAEAKKEEEKKITPYGTAQYRLRVHSSKKGDGDFESEYSHKISYSLGVKAAIGSKFSAALQLGNKYIATETVKFDPTNDLTPIFHLAYAKWDPGFLNLTVGMIPMTNNGALDLIERSMTSMVGNSDSFSSLSYKGASQVSWAVGTENSMTGVQVGVPILKKDIKLGFDVAATVVEGADKMSQTKALWVFNVPFKVSILSLTPQIALFQNRIVNDTTFKKDHEIAAGFKAGVKPHKNISLGLAMGLAKIDDESTKSEDADVQKKKGKFLSFSSKIKAGPGAIQFAYNVSNHRLFVDDEETEEEHIGYHYIDLKYGLAAHKNFIVMPRIRFFMNRWADDAIKDANKTTSIRPELIFIGKF